MRTGWGTEIAKVIMVVKPGGLYLAPDNREHFLVYDSQFEPVPPSRQDETVGKDVAKSAFLQSGRDRLFRSPGV